jgi:hypothetical protein
MIQIIEEATRTQEKARIAIYGPSGSGKTFSALRIAKGIASVTGDKTIVIDSEKGRASKNAGKFDDWKFATIKLPDFSIDTYLQALKAAADAGYGIVILDSITHAWDWLKNAIDQKTASSFGGNKWAAWSWGTPKQMEMIQALHDYPGHILCTMRSKTEWAQEKDERGKTKPQRVGLAPEQRGGVEYEFDVLMRIDVSHVALVEKDNSGIYQDKEVQYPGEEQGVAWVNWLMDATPPATLDEQIAEAFRAGGFSDDRISELTNRACVSRHVGRLQDMTDHDKRAFVRHLNKLAENEPKAPAKSEPAGASSSQSAPPPQDPPPAAAENAPAPRKRGRPRKEPPAAPAAEAPAEKPIPAEEPALEPSEAPAA